LTDSFSLRHLARPTRGAQVAKRLLIQRVHPALQAIRPKLPGNLGV